VLNFSPSVGRTAVGSDAQWVLSPGGDDAFLLYGLFDRLSASLSLREGRLRWCRRLSDGYPVPMTTIERKPVLFDGQLWWSEGHSCMR
jgi:hypothetical protein